jgi:hypothetical protein
MPDGNERTYNEVITMDMAHRIKGVALDKGFLLLATGT